MLGSLKKTSQKREENYSLQNFSDLDLSRVVAVEDGGCVALEAEVVVEEGGAEEGQVLKLVQGHRLLHKLPSLKLDRIF